MVLEHDVIAKHGAEDLRGLVDDGGERNAIDNAVHAMRLGVIEREAERGKRLASARRHVQREDAAGKRSLVAGVGENAGAQESKRAIAGTGRQVGDVRIEASDEAIDEGGEAGQSRSGCVPVCFA